MAREIDLSKPLDEDTIAYLKATRPDDYVNRMIELASSGDVKADGAAKGEEPFDPSTHNVQQVLDHLLTASEDEAERVIEAERAGQARKGILEQA